MKSLFLKISKINIVCVVFAIFLLYPTIALAEIEVENQEISGCYCTKDAKIFLQEEIDDSTICMSSGPHSQDKDQCNWQNNIPITTSAVSEITTPACYCENSASEMIKLNSISEPVCELAGSQVSAANNCAWQGGVPNPGSGSTGGSSGTPPEPTKLINPIGGSLSNPEGIKSIPAIIGKVIQAALGIAGSLALVAFIYGSFLWLTSAGKSEKIQEGVRTMTYAAIGLFVIFASYGILGQIINALIGG